MHVRAPQILRDRGQASEAQTAIQEAISAYELLQQHAEREASPNLSRHAERLALCQSHLGQTRQVRGDLEGADQAYTTAIRMLQGAAAKSPRIRDALAFVQQHRAALLESQGHHAEASQAFASVKQIWAELAAAKDAAADHRYHLAWFLVTCPQGTLRDPKKALLLAQELTSEAPGNATFWSCRGIASYRAGDWKSAAETLEKAAKMKGFDDARDWFFLAMSHGQLKDERSARAAYLRARQAFEQCMPGNLEAGRMQLEAALVLKGDSGATANPGD